LKRLAKLRDDMPAFVTTDQEAVKAAKRAADAAAKTREAECKRRGEPCREREDAETAANAKLTKVTEAKAATDKASKLEIDAKVQRDLLATLGPIVKVDAQGAAIAGLFRLPDEEAGFLATAQQFFTAAVVELIILVCLIGWEVSRTKNEAPAPEPPVRAPPEPTVIEAEPLPTELPPPPRPRLATPSNERPAGFHP
jgi:hypothetical protein